MSHLLLKETRSDGIGNLNYRDVLPIDRKSSRLFNTCLIRNIHAQSISNTDIHIRISSPLKIGLAEIKETRPVQSLSHCSQLEC